MFAKIYLSGNRGIHELPWFRSYHMFNFGSYQDEHRDAPGDLYVFNEDTLAAGRKFSLIAEENSRVVLIPLVGAIACNNELPIAGESLVVDAMAGETLCISNPYENDDELVNFIQLWFKQPKLSAASSHVYPFSIDDPDKMNDVMNGTQTPLFSIGKYKGRGKGVYEKKEPSNALFVFVIEGVFEVEDRLLHTRDGLELNGFDAIEFEALSNNAIIMVTESDMTTGAN